MSLSRAGDNWQAPAEEPGPSYLTVDEAAALARCDPKTIRRAAGRGQLRAYRPAHRVILREDDVRAWIESHTTSRTDRDRPHRTRRGRPASPGSVAALRAIEEELAR